MSDSTNSDTDVGGGRGRTTNRRRVLQGLGAVGLGGSLSGFAREKTGEKDAGKGKGEGGGDCGKEAEEIPISTQFWTYNENSDLSVSELIYESAEAGYDAVEPFYLDDEDAIADALSETGLEFSSAHVDIGTLEDDFEGTVSTYSEFGADFLIHAYKADGTWESEESILEWADRINEMADRLAEKDIQYGYHNHDQEFQMIGDRFGFDIFAEALNDNVHIQFDVGWALVGGADPISVLKRHSDKIGSLHMKDMTEDGEFTEIGEGDVYMGAIANVARSSGVDYLIYEYDAAPNPIESLYTGADFLERWNHPRCQNGVSADEWPPRVVPGAEGLGTEPPSDATVLWDGDEATLDQWQHSNGGAAAWIQRGGDGEEESYDYFETRIGSGDIQPDDELGDVHLHLEWRVPEGLETEEGGDGQGPGNSGLFMMNTYEFQILQSYDNPTYPSGYAGSFYMYTDPEDSPGGDAPLVLPIRPPGEWQEYDMVWRGPRFEDGELVRYPQATLFFNGVAVQVHNDIPGPVWYDTMYDFDHEEYGHPRNEDGEFLEEVPFSLQDHGGDQDKVHFRNIWYRDLPEEPVEIESPDEMPEYDTAGGDYEEPEQVSPGGVGTTGDAPADAETLIDGGDLSAWTAVDGEEVGWHAENDYVEVKPGAGDIETQQSFGDAQFHVEYRIPDDVEGRGTDRGASGVLMMGEYEIQIVDTYLNAVEPTLWAGAYVDQAGPHSNATRRPGEWQQLDIVWQGPQFADGALKMPAQVTAFLNGVAVQTRLLVDGPNADGSVDEYEPHESELPLRLQEADSRVQFRNTWARSLD